MLAELLYYFLTYVIIHLSPRALRLQTSSLFSSLIPFFFSAVFSAYSRSSSSRTSTTISVQKWTHLPSSIPAPVDRACHPFRYLTFIFILGDRQIRSRITVVCAEVRLSHLLAASP